MNILQKLLWAIRVLRSKSYIVLTDKEAVISLKIRPPETLEDVVVLESQLHCIKAFQSDLDELAKQFKTEVGLLRRRNRLAKRK